MGECTLLDGGEYTKTSKQTETNCLISIRTKISTLIGNIEHDVSLTTSIYLVHDQGK